MGGKNSKLTCDVAARLGEQRRMAVQGNLAFAVHAARAPAGGSGLDPAPQDDGQFAAAQALDPVKLKAGRGEPAAHRVVGKAEPEMRVLLLELGAVVLGEIDHQQAAARSSTRAASAIAAPGCWA